MRVNPSLVKQHARKVAPFGLPLWHTLVQAGSSGSADGRLSIAQAQIRQQLAGFAAQSAANKQFVVDKANRNLANHLTVFTQILTALC